MPRGGARPGAGRPKKKLAEAVVAAPNPDRPKLPAVAGQSPEEFLLAVQNDPSIDPALRVRAAIAALAAGRAHADRGKKAEAERNADAAGSTGRLTAVPPPRLKVA